MRRGFGQTLAPPPAPTSVPFSVGSIFDLPATIAHSIYPWPIHDMIDGPSIIIDVATWGLLLYFITRR